MKCKDRCPRAWRPEVWGLGRLGKETKHVGDKPEAGGMETDEPERHSWRGSRGSMRSIGRECVICMDRRRAVRLHPCDHALFCYDCAVRTPRATCPICRAPVECIRPVLERLARTRTAPSIRRFSMETMRMTRSHSLSGTWEACMGVALGVQVADEADTIPVRSEEDAAELSRPPKRVLVLGTSDAHPSRVVSNIRSRFRIPSSSEHAHSSGGPNACVDGVLIRIKAIAVSKEELDTEFINGIRATQPDIVILCCSGESLKSFEKILHWDLSLCELGWMVPRVWVVTRRGRPSRSFLSFEDIQAGLHYIDDQRRCVHLRLDSPINPGLHALAMAIVGKRLQPKRRPRFQIFRNPDIARGLHSIASLMSTISKVCRLVVRSAFRARGSTQVYDPFDQESADGARWTAMPGADSIFDEDDEEWEGRFAVDFWHDARDEKDGVDLPITPAACAQNTLPHGNLSSWIGTRLGDIGWSAVSRISSPLLHALGLR